MTTPNSARLAVRIKSRVFRRGKIKDYFEKFVPPAQVHEKEYTMEELKQILHSHGFSVKRAFYGNWTSASALNFFRCIYLVVTSIHPTFKEDLFIEVKKAR